MCVTCFSSPLLPLLDWYFGMLRTACTHKLVTKHVILKYNIEIWRVCCYDRAFFIFWWITRLTSSGLKSHFYLFHHIQNGTNWTLWSKAKTDIQGSAYHLKALELTSSTSMSDNQYAQWGCAGIARQLHPLKAGHSIKMSGSKAKIDTWGSACHLKALDLKSSTYLLGCRWAHRGCAGIGRQLHPLKANT